MQSSFLQLIDKARLNHDLKREQFLEYLMKKYLVDNNLFMTMVELAPLLDPLDLEELNEIINPL